MESTGSIALLRREPRATVILLVVILLGWVFLVWAVTDMTNPLARLMMPMDSNWTMGNIVAVFAMWAGMMMAMMLPAAAPMILTFANLCRQRQRSGLARVFVTAYLLIWTLFSAAAVALQWGLQVSGLITPMMASSSIWLTGILLLVAGAVQFTPLKEVCLRHCRTPMGFLLTEWRDGADGALYMGFKHGFYCLGCCWAMMGLLFVAGVMNLAWVAALTAAVVIEKIHPAGVKIGKFLGGILILAGLAQIANLAVG
jgi:predicted metal-binding membrane protein